MNLRRIIDGLYTLHFTDLGNEIEHITYNIENSILKINDCIGNKINDDYKETQNQMSNIFKSIINNKNVNTFEEN